MPKLRDQPVPTPKRNTDQETKLVAELDARSINWTYVTATREYLIQDGPRVHLMPEIPSTDQIIELLSFPGTLVVMWPTLPGQLRISCVFRAGKLSIGIGLSLCDGCRCVAYARRCCGRNQTPFF